MTTTIYRLIDRGSKGQEPREMGYYASVDAARKAVYDEHRGIEGMFHCRIAEELLDSLGYECEVPYWSVTYPNEERNTSYHLQREKLKH